MNPRHNLVEKMDTHFREFKIRHDIKQRYRKFIWGTFTGDSTRSFWKHKRKSLTYYRKMYHVDYDSDHDDYEFLTHPKNIINAQKRRRALRIVKVKLQKLFYEEEDRYLLQKPPYVDEEFHPNTNSRTMKFDLQRFDKMEHLYMMNKMLPIFFNEGFLTYLQENKKFTNDLYYKLQQVFTHKKLKKYGKINVLNYIKNGIKYIGKKYQKKDLVFDLMDNENNNGKENWRKLRLKAHPHLRHYETDQNLQDEQSQMVDFNLGEQEYEDQNFSNLNVTETFEKISTKLKQIIKINPKSLFRFSYFLKSYLFLLQAEFQGNEISDLLQNPNNFQSKAIFQIKKKAEKWIRSKYMERSNKNRKQSDTVKQYQLLVKQIESEVNKKEKKRQKQMEMQAEPIYERDIQRHQWMNFNQGIKQVSQIMGNENSFLHQDDIFVDEFRDQDQDSINDELKKKKLKKRTIKKNSEKKKTVQKKKKIQRSNYFSKKISIRQRKQEYRKIIQNYHDIRLFQDLLDKEDFGFPQEYLQYIQVEEESNQERSSSRRSKSVPSKGNKQRQIKQKRSYSQEKMSDLLEKFDSITQKECQRDLFRIASTMMKQKEVDFRDQYYKRIKNTYFKSFKPRKQNEEIGIIMEQFIQNEQYFNKKGWLRQFKYFYDQQKKQKEIEEQGQGLTRYELGNLRRQHKMMKKTKKLNQSEDDYWHRIFLKQLISQDKEFFTRMFGIDVVENYLYYYKQLASQLFDNCQVCLESEEEDNNQDNDNDQEFYQDLDKELQQHSEEDQISPEKQITKKENTLTKEQIMPLYLKLAKKHQRKMKKRVQKAEAVLDDKFSFENDKLDNILNTNKRNAQNEDLRNYYGMQVEINNVSKDEDEGEGEVNQSNEVNDDGDNNYQVGFGFGPKEIKKPTEEKFKILHKFKKLYLGRNRWKYQKENNDQIDLKFPLFQDMYKDETQSDCFSRGDIYFDRTQRGQHHQYLQLLTIQCRPQVSKQLQEKIQDSSKPNLLRVKHKNIYEVQSSDILKNLNLKDYPIPIDILKEQKDVLIQNEFKERVWCLRYHNLPIQPIRLMENEYEAQINYYRKFAQYTGLRDMPKHPDNPYQTYKQNNFKGQESISKSIKAVRGWMGMSLRDRKNCLRTFYSEVVMCYQKLDKWLQATNFDQEDLYFMGVMDLEDFVWHLYNLDIFCEILEKQVKLAAVSFDDVLIHYIRRNLKKRHPDKMNKQKIQKLIKLRRDPKARALAKKQEMKKKVKKFRKKKNQERKRINIAILQARRNKKQAFLYAKYFGKNVPLLRYFENVFVQQIRVDVEGIMRKQIRKYKLKEKIIYVDGKGYQKDRFIECDYQGYQRKRALKLNEKYGDGGVLQNIIDTEQFEARKNKTWINQDHKNIPPSITKTSNNIQIDERKKDYKNQVRICRKLYFDNISQKSKELAEQQNIETNNHIFQKKQENLGYTTIQFDDNEWLVSSHDVKPFKQLVDMAQKLEQKEQESILRKKINSQNKKRRIILRDFEVRYKRKKNLYIYRDLPDDQAPADPREFILGVDEDGILNRLNFEQHFGKWSQNVAYYKAKGWDLTPLLFNQQKEIEGPEQKKEKMQQKLLRQKLKKELRENKKKANGEKSKFLREKKKTQYIASMLKIDENYGKQFENSDEKIEQENQQLIESEVPDLKLSIREKIKMRQILRRLQISQQDQSETGINQLTKFVKDNKDPVSNLYENLVVVEQLQKEIQDPKPFPLRVHKPWFKKKRIKQPSPIRPFLDENANVVKGMRKIDYLKDLYARQQIEDQRINAELAELRIKRQGMTQQEILDELLKTPKEEQRPQVKRAQLQDIVSGPIAISKKKNITKKKQKKDSDESSSEREQKKGRHVKQVSQRQTKNHQVKQTKGKQENQQVKQGVSKVKGKPQKLGRNFMDKEEQEEIEQESQIILENKKRQRKVHKNKVPILFDSSDDQDEQSADISFDDSSDEKQKNKKKGGQKQKGKNNRK